MVNYTVHTHRPRSDIILFSMSNRSSLTRYTWPTMQRYCNAQGYAWITSESPLDERHPSWSKIPFALSLIRDHFIENHATIPENITRDRYLIWVDDDMLITRPDIPITRFLDDFKNSSACIAMGEDIDRTFNCGLMIMKVDDPHKLARVLETVWDQCLENEKHEPLWEQSTMHRLWHQGVIRENRDIFILPIRSIQSFYGRDPAHLRWRDGDFIAHVSGIPIDRRITLASELYERLERTPGNTIV